MITIRTYQPYVAAILIALHGFIASVQLWHHHNHFPVTVISKTELTAPSDQPDQGAIAQDSDIDADADCPVCSHKFLTYQLATPQPLESFLDVVVTQNGYHRLRLIANPSFSLPNKGPPCTA